MKRVNYNGMQMNPSATIVDEAAAEIKDARSREAVEMAQNRRRYY